MPRLTFLPILGAVFLFGGAVQVVGMVDTAPAPKAAATGPALLAGCTDIPEAVALSERLAQREARLQASLADLARQRSDLAVAQGTITERLRALKAAQDRRGGAQADQRKAVMDDIDRVIAVYNQMKPQDAAAVLTNLPADFASELLMRMDAEVGAKILAAIDPNQAAILTTHMSARRVTSQ